MTRDVQIGINDFINQNVNHQYSLRTIGFLLDIKCLEPTKCQYPTQVAILIYITVEGIGIHIVEIKRKITPIVKDYAPISMEITRSCSLKMT
mmetsp:Transcript_24986/g.40999  ORF Transcript_24986/g.40999 Transcript_24986/m.40999 type:complete len:92 (+) Transcript_24986:409-684(+)